MDGRDLEASWTRTRMHLTVAQNALNEVTAIDSVNALAEFQRFLEHNELELAMESLAAAGSEATAAAFWRSLADAADSMGIVGLANAYRSRAV